MDTSATRLIAPVVGSFRHESIRMHRNSFNCSRSASRMKLKQSMRRAYAGPHSWDFSIRLEGKVSKTAWETYMCCVVNCLSSSASETMALAVPAGFFAQGRTDWHYLSCHLPTVRHVSLRTPDTVLPRFIDPDCTSWLSTVGA